MEDSELVRRALLRDQQAFAALYDRYADRLFDYARRQTGNSSDAGDIVQDTFVLALQRLHQLRDPSLLRPWLYAIARSEVHRRYRRINRLQFTEPDEQAAMSAQGPTADELVHQQELRALFTAAADGLDPSDREVLDLHLRHSMNGTEIAATLGIPERQVSVTVQRVRERLGRSIGVVLLSRNPACDDLSALQRTEGSPLTVLSRKRLARHIDGCTTCSQQLHDRMRPEALLTALPIALAPAVLRDTVLRQMATTNALGTSGPGQEPSGPGTGGRGNGDSSSQHPRLRRRENTRNWQRTDGFPRPAVSLRLLAVVALTSLVLVLAFITTVIRSGDSARRITVGTTTTASAAKPLPSDTAATTSPGSTPMLAEPTPQVTTAPPPQPTSTQPTATPAITAPPTTAPDTAAPVFLSAAASPTALSSSHPGDASATCSPAVDAVSSVLTVDVTDDRGVVAVTVRYVVAAGVGERALSRVGNVWQVPIGPFAAAEVPTGITHQINAVFTAVDAAGNSRVANVDNIATLIGCPIIT
jgi:RNA polymerase sigma factor (sigma-70 family)